MSEAGRSGPLAVAAPRLAVAGVLMPVWLLGFSTILGLTRPGYDLYWDPISKLGADGVPNAALWQLGGFLASAVLEIVFAAALWGVFGRTWVAGLTAAFAALLAVSAAAPQDSALADVHMLAGLLAFGSFALVPLAAWRLFRRRPGYADLARVSMLVGAALVGWYVVELGSMIFPLGIWERVFLVIGLGWQIVIALRVRGQAIGRV